MNFSTKDELDRQLLSDEENLVFSLEEYKNAKANLRKARITSITNKLLAPYRRFKIEQAIAKYDAMLERLEKKREKELRRAEKLQEMEQKRERRQAQGDFKAAIRERRKEDIINFANDTKEKTINFGKEIGSDFSDTFSYIREMGTSRVSTAASFVSSVKNTAIKKIKENTTIDLIIKKTIEDVKLKYATDKYNKALDKKTKKEEQERREKLNAEMELDEVVRADYKRRDIPFSNINEKIQKVSRQSSYMGKATNRVVKYFKSKKDEVITSVNNKILDAGIGVDLKAYVTISKVSMAKSKIITTFNNKLDKIKEKTDNAIGDAIVGVQDTMDSINSYLNKVKGDIQQTIEDRKDRIDRKKDMVAALREQDERDIAIKRAQLDSMREALKTVNNTGDIFSNAPSLEVGRAK